MKPYKTFVINLQKNSERQHFVSKQLELLEMDYIIFNAIDGDALSQEKYEELVDKITIAPKLKWLTRGAIGCALSHYEVLKLISNEDVSFALVLEDDCILNKKLPQLLDSISNSILEYEIILLYYSSTLPIQLNGFTDNELGNGFCLYNAVEPKKLASSVAYIISRNASERLMNFAVPIKTTADDWGYFLENQVIQNIKCVYPMPVNTASFRSTLDYIAKDSFLGRLSVFIDKYKVFPVYQILKFRRRRNLEKRKNIKVL